MTAEDDQQIMESYSRRLKATLSDKLRPEVALDSPEVLVNVLEHDGVKYLVLVNDKRTYSPRTGKYRAVLEQLAPQSVMVTLDRWTGPLHPYDLLARKPLATQATGTGYCFRVDLDELGGEIVALYPVRPARLDVSVPSSTTRGHACQVTIAVQDEAGRNLPGLQPLHVVVTDPKGNPTEYTGYYCAESGRMQITVMPAINDEVGSWQVRIEDLTAGMTAEAAFELR